MAVETNASFAALVMFNQTYRDKDLLVKLLTKEYGKKMFFLKNAKQANFQLASAVLPFSYGKYIGLIRDTGLSYINTVDQVDQFQNIFNDIELNGYATLIINLIDAAFEDNQPISTWFQIVQTALQLIDAGVDAEIISDIIQLQLLPSFGITINWFECVQCGRSDLPLQYSVINNGVLCENHWNLDEHRWIAEPKVVKTIQLLSRVPINQLGEVKVSVASKDVIWKILDQIYKDQVGINLKSRSFIDQMKSWN